MVRLAVILLNYRNPGDTLACLESLVRSGLSASNAKIFLVNNFPQDGSGAVIRAFLEASPVPFEYMEPGFNTGFAGGCNHGIRKALQGNISHIVLLNNDTVVDAKFTHETCRLAEEHPDDILAGLVREAETGKVDYNIGRISHWTGRVHHIFNPEYKGEIDFVSGCLMVVPRKVIEETGGFDERLFMYAEDLDLSLRFKKNGYQVRYCPSILVQHKFSASVKSSGLPKEYYIQRNQILVTMKNGSPLQKLLCVIYAFLIPPYKVVKRPDLFLQVVRGVRDGLLGLDGKRHSD